MGSDLVTIVANSVHHHNQSISVGIYDSDTAWQNDWNEVALRCVDGTCHHVCRGTFTKSAGSLSWQKVDINVTCQMLQEDVQTIELVTNDTTPHVYRKAMLVVAFDSSMWIIMVP